MTVWDHLRRDMTRDLRSFRQAQVERAKRRARFEADPIVRAAGLC